jgi:hypothetical protein
LRAKYIRDHVKTLVSVTLYTVLTLGIFFPLLSPSTGAVNARMTQQPEGPPPYCATLLVHESTTPSPLPTPDSRIPTTDLHRACGVTVDDDGSSGRRQPTGSTRNRSARRTSWFAVDGSAARRRQSRHNRDLTENVIKHQIHTTYVWTLSVRVATVYLVYTSHDDLNKTPKQSPFRERYEGLRADGRHGP